MLTAELRTETREQHIVRAQLAVLTLLGVNCHHLVSIEDIHYMNSYLPHNSTILVSNEGKNVYNLLCVSQICSIYWNLRISQYSLFALGWCPQGYNFMFP